MLDLNISPASRELLIKNVEECIKLSANQPAQEFLFLMLAVLHDHEALFEIIKAQNDHLNQTVGLLESMRTQLLKSAEAMERV